MTRGSPGLARLAIGGTVGVFALLVTVAMVAPLVLFAGGSMMYSTSQSCSSGQASGAAQPTASGSARNSIPANYLRLFRSLGARYRVPWVILAGIGKVESDDGQTTLPGVHSGSNAFGAAGPMQIGIGGAAGNTWGGAPVHRASLHVNGVATDANGDGTASVYDPADAIAGAAKYLLEHGVLTNAPAAIFAYNHLQSYVQAVLGWAGVYSKGGYVVSAPTGGAAPSCLPGAGLAASNYAAAAISFAQNQLGKPYQWGGTGPEAYDCSGLVMEAYRAAGIYLPRTSQEQWKWGPRVKPSQVEPGDLVFFAGSDGTPTAPGHVGIVIGNGMMIEAPSQGLSVRVTMYRDKNPVGFTRPWEHSGARLTGTNGS